MIMKKLFTREVKIALVAIVGVILLFFGLNFLKGKNIFSDDNTYKLQFADVSGLSNSAPIYANGYRVGSVTGFTYDYDNPGRIIVLADIDKQLRIPAGTTAKIVSDLMGNTQVNLHIASNTGSYINANDIIYGEIDEGALGETKALIPAVQAILPKLDSIMASLNVLLADPAIANTLHNAEKTTANLTTTTAQINRLMATLNAEVPGIITKTSNVMGNAETLTGNLAEIDIAGTMAKVDATLNNVQQLTDALNNRQGSLGMLLYDQGLYNNLTATMRDADSLMIDVKARPGRYINFSVFGKKVK